jgi:hypothetical protein
VSGIEQSLIRDPSAALLGSRNYQHGKTLDECQDLLYADPMVIPAIQVPQVPLGRHTMGQALPTYVSQRVATQFLDQALKSEIPIEVHGIYPAHVPQVLAGARFVGSVPEFPYRKRFNRVRPSYFICQRFQGVYSTPRLVIAIPPGRDYVLHHASLISYYLEQRGGSLSLIVRYPQAEESITEWTSLGRFLDPGDHVLIGYVQELVPLLAANGAKVEVVHGNEYYGAARLTFPGARGTVYALGIRYSFWGSISAKLAVECLRRGAVELIYAGKLGTLTTPKDIYKRLFVPSDYMHYRPEGEHRIPAIVRPNGLLTHFPDLDTGLHLSVDTIMEEDFHLRDYATSQGVSSIDNEISQIAIALAAEAYDRPFRFSAVHFATDYLPRHNEHVPEGLFNLTNHHLFTARGSKSECLNKVALLLGRYYQAL